MLNDLPLQVNMMEAFKRSTSRDFRINHQAVDAILNEDEGEEEMEGEKGESKEGENEIEEEDEGEESPEERFPRSKRLKL